MQATQKIVNLALLVAGGAVFLFMMNLVRSIWSLARLPRMSEWILEPYILISLFVSAGAAFYARRNGKANRFLNDVTQELSKVTWPSRKETSMSTGISCILVVICSLILLMFDSLWGTMLRGFFSL